MKLKLLLAMPALAFGLAACETFTPYDYDDPDTQRRDKADSCRIDPYQDRCKPGGVDGS